MTYKKIRKEAHSLLVNTFDVVRSAAFLVTLVVIEFSVAVMLAIRYGVLIGVCAGVAMVALTPYIAALISFLCGEMLALFFLTKRAWK